MSAADGDTSDVEDNDIDVIDPLLDDSTAIMTPGELIIVKNDEELLAYEAIKAAQQAKLMELREQHKQEMMSSSSSSRSDGIIDHRLAYLMKQSEIFSHFMVGDTSESTTSAPQRGRKRKANSSSTSSKAGAGGGPGRRQKTEEEEDQEMMKAAESKGVLTWLNSQPTCIVSGTMRPYQLEGLNWLIRLHDNNINGILADEMGLGKTLQVISLLGYLKEHRCINGPHLVISPKSTISGWMREMNRWCPSLRAVRLQGSKQERALACKTELIPGQFDVVVASNESVLREFGYLKKFKWRYVIIDEAHRIKNENSSLSKLVRVLVTDFKVLITGTPLQNNLHELWALLNFLLPEVFDSATLFDSWFNTADQTATQNVVQRLHSVLKPFMLRRVKADVEKELPPKKETKLYIGMTELQRMWYTKVLAKDVASLNSSAAATDRVRLLNTLMQLRKVCNHPYLFDGAEEGPPYVDGPHIWQNSGKMLVISKLLPKLFEQGSRPLIFCQMTRMLDILEDYLRMFNFKYCRIDGSTDSAQRDEAMDAFNRKDSDIFCFLLSTRAGGLGINLQTADTVILYDSDWNPQADLQAMDRAHRIGQRKEVRVFRLVTEKSVEEKVVERADRKLFLDAAVIQQGRLAEKHAQLSKAELMAMVRFGADEIMNSKDGMITDEDIDHLLRRGEERTQADSDKLKTEMQHNLANFSIAMDENVEINLLASDADAFVVGGTSGNKRKLNAALPTTFISLPQRERKKTIDVDTYFKEALSGGTSSSTPKDPKPIKRKCSILSRPDFQLFDKPFFEAYNNQLDALALQKVRVQESIKSLLSKDAKARRQSSKRQAVVASTSVETADYSNRANHAAVPTGGESAESSDQSEFAIEAAQLSREIADGVYDIPEEIVEERKRKLAEGFSDWTRADFKCFCEALERCGRRRDRVAMVVANETSHSVEVGGRYYDLFMQRYETVQDWPKIMERADKGDKRAMRESELTKALEKKVAKHPNPWVSFPISYQGTKGKLFSSDNDIFIILTLHKYGYGCWDTLSREIKLCPRFRFDWFFKTRNEIELQRRADFLLRHIEKEIDNDETIDKDTADQSSALELGAEES